MSPGATSRYSQISFARAGWALPLKILICASMVSGRVSVELLVAVENLLLDPPPRLVVQRVGDVPERPVLPLLARHRDEQTVGSLDDLDVADHEAVVEDHRDERFELLFLDGEDSDVRDVH